MSEVNNRFMADDPPNGVVNVVGCGAVGSFVAPILARWGCSMNLWDGDDVAYENFMTQNFEPVDYEQPKVRCLANKLWWTQYLRQQEGDRQDLYYMSYNCTPDDQEDPLIGHVFLCVDNMHTRERLLHHSKPHNIGFVIDTRTGFTFSEVGVYDWQNPNHRKRFEATLFSDEDAEEQPCGRRMHPIVAAFTATWACSLFRAALREKLGNRTLFQLDHEHMTAYGDMADVLTTGS